MWIIHVASEDIMYKINTYKNLKKINPSEYLGNSEIFGKILI